MKICYILPHFYPHVGGGEQAFLDLISELKKKEDVELRVITSNSGGVTGKKEYNGIKIYYCNWKIMFGHPWVQKKDLEEHVKWADIVHVGVYSPVVPALCVCRNYNKPSIVTAHEVLGEKWYWIEKNKIKATLFYLYERFIVSQKCTSFHTPSDASKRDLHKYNKKANVKTIYWISEKKTENINIDKQKYYDFFGISSKDRVFLNYGRPGKTKGIFIYLKAIIEVIKKSTKEELENIRFCFIMANDPLKEKEKFLKIVKEENIGKYVIVKDSTNREDLFNYIECADYIVVPSITEGFGLTAIEACEKNKKVIHSSGGSLPEVTFGENIMFKNRNSHDLAKCLEKVIKPFESNPFTVKAKKDFSKKTIVNNFYELYKGILNK